MSLSAYVPILALAALAAAFTLFSVGISQLVGPGLILWMPKGAKPTRSGTATSPKLYWH
jgi:hypothetical protein